MAGRKPPQLGTAPQNPRAGQAARRAHRVPMQRQKCETDTTGHNGVGVWVCVGMWVCVGRWMGGCVGVWVWGSVWIRAVEWGVWLCVCVCVWGGGGVCAHPMYLQHAGELGVAVGDKELLGAVLGGAGLAGVCQLGDHVPQLTQALVNVRTLPARRHTHAPGPAPPAGHAREDDNYGPRISDRPPHHRSTVCAAKAGCVKYNGRHGGDGAGPGDASCGA
jgi:hypothetical protein